MSEHEHRYQALGLHPLVAFAVVAVDLMLFGGEATTGGVSWVVSIGVAVALALPAALLQRYAYKDNWGTAIGKAGVLAVLTAIPTPIPAIFPAAAGILGMFRKPAALLPASTESQTSAARLPERQETASLEEELSRVVEKHGAPNAWPKG